ncbi:hypothetical protein E8E78_04195 [Pseudomonas sp. BN505]|nr:hypothetical protein [Pseudomonas sp. BN605]MDH4855809.1 hypothetical protein [Pseudomonas sp. BN505]
MSGAWIGNCLTRPFRRQASSHSYTTSLEGGGTPVGAGLPAKGPGQAVTPEPTSTPSGCSFVWICQRFWVSARRSNSTMRWR